MPNVQIAKTNVECEKKKVYSLQRVLYNYHFYFCSIKSSIIYLLLLKTRPWKTDLEKQVINHAIILKHSRYNQNFLNFPNFSISASLYIAVNSECSLFVFSFHISFILSGLLIGCGKKWEILRHFQGKLCSKLCRFFKADLTLFF